MKATKTCEYCREPFSMKPRYSKPRFERLRYCGKSCSWKARINPPRRPRCGQVFSCGTCGKEFYLHPSRVKTGSKRGKRYCSRDCNNKSLFTNRPLNCVVCGSEFYCPRSQELYRNRKTCSLECKGILTGRRNSGPNCHFWRGGVSSENRKIRYSARMEKWRKTVFTRDDYMCQHCGARSGKGRPVHLHAHHVKSFAYYPELRFEVSNGLTLCRDCHRAVEHERRAA